MSTVLEVDGLQAGYGNIDIVHDLHLRVDEGEVVALLGPNGAGKTTTISTLSGELRALGGEVSFLGARTDAPMHIRAVRASVWCRRSARSRWTSPPARTCE